MQRLAQAWLILRLTHNNGFALGIESGLQFLPVLLFGAWGGVIADRYDKRKLLYLSQIVAGFLALGLGLIVALGAATVVLDYVFSVLLGFVNVIDNSARQTFVMEMVGREELPNAVGLNRVVMNSSRVVVGMDVAQKLEALAPASGDGPPTQKVTMEKVIVTDA